MSLISGLYYSGDPKQKPKQWGPVSVVQSAFRDNFNNLGIDYSKVPIVLPLWSPGDQINYALKSSICNNSGATFTNSALQMSGQSLIVPFDISFRSTEFTVFSQLEKPTGSDIFKVSYITGERYSTLEAHYQYTNEVWMAAYLYNVTGDSLIKVYAGTDKGKRAKNVLAWRYKESDHTINNFFNGASYTDAGIAGALSTGTNNLIINANLVDINLTFFVQINTALDDAQIQSIADNPYQLWNKPTFRTYFDFGSTAPYISCNLLAAAAQATKVIQ